MIPVAKPWLGEEEARAAADAVCSGWVAQWPRVESNFQSFWIELDGDYPLTRNELLSTLAAEGISARAGIMAAHRQPAYADHPRVDLPVTERLTDNTLILPLFHTMGDDDQAAVVGAIRRAAGLGFDA